MSTKVKQKSIAKNYLYNLVYQVLVVLFPLLTTPYLSRVLGAEKIGIYSFTLSVSAYFILFGSLGISLYGQREIAYRRKNKQDYSRTLWEIVALRAIMVTLSLIIYFCFFTSQGGEYGLYYQILTAVIVASIFDISWFFQGLEDFKKTISRNIIVRILSIISIFIFVKSKDDLILYFIIYAASNILGNLSLWLYLPKLLEKVKLSSIKPFRHLKATILLFIPQIAIEIYTVLDKTMIGVIISDKSEVGYYDQAQKIIKVSMTLVTAIGTVMMPRIASKYADGDNDGIIKYIHKSFNLVLAFGIPLVVGIMATASAFVPFFFGEGYDKVVPLMMILSPIILFIGMSNGIGMQYLLPVKRQNEFTTSVVIGCLTNLIINLLLIPQYGAIGAAIGTLIAELSVTATQLAFTRKQFRIKTISLMATNYLIGAAVMLLSIIFVRTVIPLSGAAAFIVPVAVGFVSYTTTLLIMRDDFLLMIIRKANIFRKHKA